jgi:SHS2 domain-containing protein
MDGKKRFEFLEHTADVYIAAYGRDLAEAFENAACAMFEVMTDAGKIVPRIEESVQVTAADEYGLLYSWLESLLVKFDTEQIMYSKFKIAGIDRGNEGFSLTARVWGEKFDARRHPQRVGIKAVTYHRMEIIREPKAVTVKFILDI